MVSIFKSFLQVSLIFNLCYCYFPGHRRLLIQRGFAVSHRRLSFCSFSVDLDVKTDNISDSEDLPSFVSRLKLVAAQHKRLADDEKNEIMISLKNHLKNMDGESLSNSIWSLGVLKCNAQDLKDELRHQLLEYISKLTNQFNRMQAVRLLTGMGKMGIKWTSLSNSTQEQLFRVALDGNEGVVPVNDSRVIPSVIYTLGQMGATSFTLPSNTNGLLQSRLTSALSSPSLLTQGLANSLWGLARMGYLSSNLDAKLSATVMNRLAQLTPEMRIDEFSSSFQSLAKLQTRWEKIPTETQSVLLDTLYGGLPDLTMRELANVIWSLGKMDVQWNFLGIDMRQRITEKLEKHVESLNNFDLESVFVGLGLLQVDFDEFSPKLQQLIFTKVEDTLPTMNVFCLHNVLWGLARMGLRITHPSLGKTLPQALLKKVISSLHTFLTDQYGDVVWALGSMGYTVSSSMSTAEADRMQAVLARVYAKLPARGAVYVLWGLGKMGFRWNTLVKPTRSLPDGSPTTEGFVDSACKCLRQRVGGLKEHEYSVLLYSLGLLEAPWSELPDTLQIKINTRLPKVSIALRPRSIANGIWGLGKMRASVKDISQEVWNEWISVLVSPRGVVAMNALEIGQTVHGISLMHLSWRDLDAHTQKSLYDTLDSRAHDMSSYGVRSTVWALAEMAVSYPEMPPNLQRGVVALLCGRRLFEHDNKAEKHHGDDDKHHEVEDWMFLLEALKKSSFQITFMSMEDQQLASETSRQWLLLVKEQSCDTDKPIRLLNEIGIKSMRSKFNGPTKSGESVCWQLLYLSK
eukprot:gene2982-5854_t